MNAEPTILSARVHFDFPTVTVEPYRTTDYFTGQEVEVDHFYQNGGLVSCTGHRVKKDGTLYSKYSTLMVRTPQNVLDALHSLRTKEQS